MNLSEKWKKFFCDAGIPASEASTYAFKFSQNRIQINMLADLNKDYLKEMGISLMGDVISILRHSKQVFEEIQKSGKSEFLDVPKDVGRKDKEVPKPKTLPSEKPTVQTEPKSQAKPTNTHTSLKRKSEPPVVPAKKRQIETVTKKVIDPATDLNHDNIEECEDLGYVVIDSSKKSFIFNQKLTDSVEKQLKTIAIEKKPEIPSRDDRIAEISNMSEDEDDDDDDDNIEVIIDEPTPYNGYRKYHSLEKYETTSKFKEYPKLPNSLADANKRAVFKRLGEEVPQYSSVSSTTAFEDDDFASKKAKDEAAKLMAEKNSVFQRLGQKCDVSSTSIDSVAEEKKSINIEFGDSKTGIVASKSKVAVKRKVKSEEKEDPRACLPACVRSTYSEGILGANSSLDRKLSLKDRLGNNRSVQDLNKTSNYNKESSGELKHRKSFPDDSYTRKNKITTKKRVSFGTVSEIMIPNREEAIKNGELAAAETRVSVFDRLGFNRNY